MAANGKPPLVGIGIHFRHGVLVLVKGELAERLGVSWQTVNAIETEKHDPSLPLAFKIAKAFGCRIEEIFSSNGSL